MTEPIYTYVKGEGWVVCNNQERIITDDSGQVIRVINRKPTPGELYILIGKGSFADGDGTFEKHCDWISTTSRYTNGVLSESDETRNTCYTYYTLEYL